MPDITYNGKVYQLVPYESKTLESVPSCQGCAFIQSEIDSCPTREEHGTACTDGPVAKWGVWKEKDGTWT